MADENGDDHGRPDPTVTVLNSHRMSDPAVHDDVVHGKRFTDPKTGRPASMVDILEGLGMIRPDAARDPEGGGQG